MWQCRFDTGRDSFAAKIVEVLRPSDTEKRQRLRNEFKIHLILDEAYRSGRIRDRIAPRCYGAFEGSDMDVLVLDLCDGILTSWDDLSASERYASEIMSNDCSCINNILFPADPTYTSWYKTSTGLEWSMKTSNREI